MSDTCQQAGCGLWRGHSGACMSEESFVARLRASKPTHMHPDGFACQTCMDERRHLLGEVERLNREWEAINAERYDLKGDLEDAQAEARAAEEARERTKAEAHERAAEMAAESARLRALLVEARDALRACADRMDADECPAHFHDPDDPNRECDYLKRIDVARGVLARLDAEVGK